MMNHRYGSALVTGSSSGIGQHIARQLAADGCDLVIVARRTSRLEDFGASLRRSTGVKIEVVTADLTTPAGLAAAQQHLTDPAAPVELLVNNAGFGVSGDFAAGSDREAQDQIRLNIAAVVQLTHAVLPGMLRAGHGGILNVSSVAGFIPGPGSAVYAATKAFVTSFSESLHSEVAARGVHVTALCPGFTRTQPDGAAARGLAALAWLEPGRVARAGIEAVSAGRAVAIPGAQYQAATAAARLLPRGAVRAARAAMRH